MHHTEASISIRLSTPEAPNSMRVLSLVMFDFMKDGSTTSNLFRAQSAVIPGVLLSTMEDTHSLSPPQGFPAASVSYLPLAPASKSHSIFHHEAEIERQTIFKQEKVSCARSLLSNLEQHG